MVNKIEGRIMKHAVTLAALLISGAAFAQSYGNPGANDLPQGAAGPGITHVQTVQGTVIAVLDPIVRNIPIGQNCIQNAQPEDRSSLNRGSVIGAITGGLLGSLVGRGDGRKVAIAAGAAGGALVGNDYYQNTGGQGGVVCQQQFEQRIVGYPYVAQIDHIQVKGVSVNPPRIGDFVTIVVRSTFWASSVN